MRFDNLFSYRFINFVMRRLSHFVKANDMGEREVIADNSNGRFKIGGSR